MLGKRNMQFGIRPQVEKAKRTILGGRLRNLRLDHGLTQEELGAELGLSACTVRYYERGRCNIKFIYARVLSILFNVNEDYLLNVNCKSKRLCIEEYDQAELNFLNSLSNNQKKLLRSWMQQEKY